VTRQAKFLAYLGGTALLILSLVYVGASIIRNWGSVEQARLHSIPWLLAAMAIYAISHLTTGLSWPLAIRQLGQRISVRDGLRIGLVAQIGKYLPGNIAHYAGRGVLAKRLGIPLRVSGIATAIELGSALTAAMLLAAAGLLLDPRTLAWLPPISTSSAAILMAATIALAAMAVWLLRKGSHPALLAAPTLCLAASFGLSSLSVCALAYALGFAPIPVPVAIGAFSLAWAAGFVVPGAPAGIGVREATLLALLSPIIGTGPAVTVAIAHRLVTAAVDALAALVGYGWLASGPLAKK